MNIVSSFSFSSSSSYEPPHRRISTPENAGFKGPAPDQRGRGPWGGMLHWIQENTFAPQWLPEPLRHPSVGYLAALLVEVAAVSLSLLILILVQDFDLYVIFTLVGVLLVSLSWGAGPGLVATLVSALLLDYTVISPGIILAFGRPADAIGMALYVVVGASISVLSGRSARERRRAEKTAKLLAQAEDRSRVDAEYLRTVLDVLPTAVLITNREGQLLAVNQASRALWGGDVPLNTDIMQFSQDKIRSVLSGEPLAPDQWTLVRALNGGNAALNDEIEIEALDGQHKVVLNSAAPIRDETGAVTGAVVSAQDISELRRLEHEVEERAQELEAIFEAMTDGIALLDAQGRLVRTNHAFGRLHGLERDPRYMEFPLEQRLAMISLADDQGRPLAKEARPISRVMRGEILTGLDVKIKNLQEREIVLNVGGAPIRDDRGNVTGCVEVFRDVTARQRVEQRTRETLGTLVAMAEAMVQIRPPVQHVEEVEAATTTLTADTTLPQVARRLAELTQSVLGCRQVSIAAMDASTGLLSPVTEVGLPPEQERAWWATWSPAQRLTERYGSASATALAAGEPARMGRRAQPERSWDPLFGAQSGWLVPMRLGEELVGVLLVDYPDIDQDSGRADEQVLTTTLAQLGALVLERDRLLRGWAETRANALALSETKAQMDTFLGIASHELKTPLTSLKLSLQMSQRQLRKLTNEKEINDGASLSDAGLRRAVEQLERTAHQMQRMESLVNDLVEVSRIQAGKLELHLAQTDLVALVREAVTIQREAAPERRIQLCIPPQLAVPVEVEGDGGRIEQVLTNFLTNALKYSPPEQPVEVGIVLGAAMRHVRVWIRDYGPGLALADQEHIWERFHRVEGVEVQSGTGVGLGLGLYICRIIVERHHGQVGVESAPGQGSTFWFSLPLQGRGR